MLRATLRSLLSRRLRLLLSAFAVVLGVTFVSGSLVLTDTLGRSFDALFTTVYENTEIEVSKPTESIGLTGQPVPVNLPASAVAQVAAVPGVASAAGQVFTGEAKVTDKRGKVVLGTGGPRYGANWVGTGGLIQLREGRGPTGAGEVAISANLARTTGYRLGDTIQVSTSLVSAQQPFTLVGITGYTGGRDSLANETIVFFAESVAQRLMLGELGVFSSVDVKVVPGADRAEIRDRIAAALGPTYQVKTGEELAADSAQDIRAGLAFFDYVLLGFAAIALLVAVLLILNTFLILVAQRTQELALFRAMGASRGQVMGSVLVQAALIGLIGSVLGLGSGVVLGGSLGALAGSQLSGGALQLASVGVPTSAIIASFVIGVGMTVVAAFIPALRAGATPPVAAMRESAIPDRPLTRLSVIGAAVLVAGGLALTLGLAGRLGDADLLGVLAGILVAFVGVAMLTPLVARPIVAFLGRALSWSAAGALGRRNSARNPRRTAITAAALMVGIAIVTAVSVVLTSVRESTVESVNAGMDADLVVASGGLAGLGTMDPALLGEVRALPEVQSTVGFYADLSTVNGAPELVQAIDDLPAAVTMFSLEAAAGSLQSIPAGGMLVDESLATSRALSIGSRVQLQLARAPAREFTVAGIYRRSALVNGIFVAPGAVQGFASPAPIQAFIKLKPGADVDAAVERVNTILADSPEVSAAKVSDFVAAQTQIFDFILIFVQLLLLMAMVIAVLGIINTLALSMTERTRELGLLRAVGMKRRQVIWMVMVESVVISVFGALLGVAVGIGLGAVVFRALADEGFTVFALPWGMMISYIIGSVIVGFLAAVIPAVLAARQNVLKAIAYE